MDPKLDRRRTYSVPRPDGQRRTDELAIRKRARQRFRMGGALLWLLAGLVGAAYGAGWISSLA
jgi:hypothetical protein